MNLEAFNRILEAGLAWAGKTSLEATALIALVVVIQLVFRRSLPPRWRYALWLLVLLRLALPAAPASPWSVFNLESRFAQRRAGRVEIVSAAVPQLPPMAVETRPMILPASDAGNTRGGGVAGLFFMAKYLWLAGCMGMLALVARQHRKLSAQIRKQETAADARATALLESCKRLLGIKREIRLVATSAVSTPALFGWRRPRLLMPGEMLRRLDGGELRLIFLHELIHLKRGDILINWLTILVRSLHWFNPAVWLAVKRLRADQEVACDAAVMSRLTIAERRLYGSTIIKLAEDFSTAGLCPSLVPFITQKQIIKRRITMVSKFKPSGRIALLACVALVIALGCLTFTRASEKTQGTPEMQAPVVPPAAANHEAARSARVSDKGISALHEQVDKLNLELREAQTNVDNLRVTLNIPSEIAAGDENTLSLSVLNHYQTARIDAETQLIRENALLREYKRLERDQLTQVFSANGADPMLNSLLQQQMAAETKLAGLKTSMGDGNPQVLETTAILKDLNQKIQNRTAAILASMEMRISSLKEVADNARKMGDEVQHKDRMMSVQDQPYFRARRDLQMLEKIRDELLERLSRAQIDQSLPQSGTNH